MTEPILHRLSDAFAERNLFLQVALGMISMSRDLDNLLQRYGCRPETQSPEVHGTPDAALAFVLGVIAFSHRVVAHADSAATPARPPAPRRRPARSARGTHSRRLLT